MNVAVRTMESSISISAAYSESALKSMRNLQQRGKFCDITVEVGQEEYFAHKVVLASVSQYFSDVLDILDNEDRFEENLLVDIDFNRLAFQTILEYIYTGNITVTGENVGDLIMASKTLKMDTLEAVCSDALTYLLSSSNWYTIKVIADEHCSEDIYRKCCKYALQHFAEITETESFLQLPLNEVKELVSAHEVVHSSEEDLYSVILKWVKHDLNNRKNDLFKLMKNVNLPLMDKTFFIKNVLRETLLRDDLQCTNLVLEATISHAGPHFKMKLVPFIFSTGGSSHRTAESTSNCEMYNPRTVTWHPITSMQSPRQAHAVIGFGQLLYAFGGYNFKLNRALSSVEYYDPLKNTWTGTTPLPHERRLHGICTINNSIFICGGRNESDKYLSSVEIFDPYTATYRTCPPMTTERAYFKMAATGGCIYAIGGANAHHLDTVEMFDHREGKWSPAPSMNNRRFRHGVTVLNGYIYCTGGLEINAVSNGERFDVRRNSWEPIPNMLNKRAGHELVALDGIVYAIGGNELKSVERFHPKSNRWVEMPSMRNKGSYVGAAVLDCIDST